MQPQPNPPQQQQQKAMIYIENLDQGISEDYLYRKFKEVGEIQGLKIAKDKTTQKSKGQAYITFAHPDSADEARRRFNDAVFIKNTIRVKAYFNLHSADKKANIFINNLPTEDARIHELEQEFSRYGTVLSLDIHRDPSGKPLNYGYVQFERKEDADRLIQEVSTRPFVYKGKVLKLEHFKAQSERKVESSAIYLRAFARPLRNEEYGNKELVRGIEFAWSQIIRHYFQTAVQSQEPKDVFVKIDQYTRQPWAMIQFKNPDVARYNLDICEQNRTHPCIKSAASVAENLVKAAPVTSDGAPQFDLAVVREYFQQQKNSFEDVFKGESDNFFFNQVYSKHLNPDDRLILVQNIRDDADKDKIHKFLSIFGKIIRLTIRKTKNPRFQVQQCFVHYQTLEDSKRARSEAYDDGKYLDQKKEIFKDGHVIMNILLSKAVRKEYKEIKKNQNTNIFSSANQRALLVPPMQPIPPQLMQQNMARNQRIPGQQAVRQPNIGRPQYQGQRAQFPGPRMPNNIIPGGQMPGYPNYPLMPQRFAPAPSVMPVAQNIQPDDNYSFNTFEKVKADLNNFGKLPEKIQRQILGRLLMQKIKEMRPDEEAHHKQIVGMLVDESQFDIGEIINFFESESELKERIEEALELLNENQNQA